MAINLAETPEIMVWPETHNVFVEKIGPIPLNPPKAWEEAHAFRSAVQAQQDCGLMSFYKVEPQIYRAGFALEDPPTPQGLTYEKFKGGKYSRFVLTGPCRMSWGQPPRGFLSVDERAILRCDDSCIE